VAQLDEAMRYRLVSRGFDSRWCHNPSCRTMALGSTQPLTEMSTIHISSGKDGRCVGLTNLPRSCADFLEISQLQPPGTIIVSPGLYRDCFTVILSLSIFFSSCSLLVHSQCLHHIFL